MLRKLFVTQIVVRDGKLLGYYCKNKISDDELDWFSSGKLISIFTHNCIPYGIAICSDIGSEEVFSKCALQGVKIIFEGSSARIVW